MTGLCDEVSGYETLAELVESHPEIEEAILIYRWEGKRSETVRYGIKLTYSHDTIDWEYSFMGPRDKLIRFASGYGIWDDPEIVFKVHRGLLIGETTGYDPSEWTEDGTPDPRWRRGCLTSEDNIRLTRVELPSGKGANLRCAITSSSRSSRSLSAWTSWTTTGCLHAAYAGSASAAALTRTSWKATISRWTGGWSHDRGPRRPIRGRRT